MKTERRHDLQTNELADWVGNSVETVKPYTKVVLGLVFAALVIFAFVAYFTAQTSRRQAEGWDYYFDALNTGSNYGWFQRSGNPNSEEFKQKAITQLSATAEQYRGTVVGSWARVELADIQIVEGMDALFADRAEANDLLRSAQQNYTIVADDPNAGDIPRQRALLGLARACEALNELDRARATYQRILDEFPACAYVNEAKRRLEDLDRPTTKTFYDWFAAQDPQPPSEETTPSPFEGLGTDGQPDAATLDELLRSLGPPAGENPAPDAGTDPAAPAADPAAETPPADAPASETPPADAPVSEAPPTEPAGTQP